MAARLRTEGVERSRGERHTGGMEPVLFGALDPGSKSALSLLWYSRMLFEATLCLEMRRCISSAPLRPVLG